MYLFNNVFTKWFPSVSVLLLLFAFYISSRPGSMLIILITGLLSAIPLILTGLKTALKGSGCNLQIFFKRPANIATLARTVLVTAGIAAAMMLQPSAPFFSRLTAAILIAGGFSADFIDGYLSRRETCKPFSALWGPWYDAESDAIVIFFACACLIYFENIPVLILIPASARYIFGLLFMIFPVSPVIPAWYFWFSKSAAAIFQIVIAVIWATLLLPGRSYLFHPFMEFHKVILIPCITFLIISSFLIEGFFRIKNIREQIPPGFRTGIFKSYLIYYLVPFRREKMFRFYRQFVSEGQLAFDVGAHIGNRIRTFLDLGAFVAAFEPQPACRRLLEAWFGEQKKVSLDFSSLGPEEKNADLIISSKYPTLASVDIAWVRENQRLPAFQKVKWDLTEKINMTTLDASIKKYGKPVFIKIDTEGFEHEVLSGLSEAVECISFEFLPGRIGRALKCIDEILRLGNFSFNFSRGESMKLFFSRWQSAEEIRSFIMECLEGAQSGDIYAKLKK